MRLKQEFSILNTISQTVNQSVDLDEILNNSLDKIMEMIGVHSGEIYLLDEKNGENLLVSRSSRISREVSGRDMKRRKLGKGSPERWPFPASRSSSRTIRVIRMPFHWPLKKG